MNKEKILSLTETWSEYFLYGFILFTPLGHAGASVCFGLLALCFVIRQALHPDFRFLKQNEHIWLLLFFIFCALSLVNSGPYLHKSLRALFSKWGGFILVFFFVREAMSEPARRQRVGWALLMTAALIGLDSLAQLFRGTDLFYAQPLLQGPHYQALTATFKNSNNLSSYLGFVTLVALAMAATAAAPKARWMSGVLAVVLGACLLLTYSRGAWIGFLGGLLLMIVLSGRWKVLLPALLVFIMFLLLNASIAQRAIPVLSLAAGKPTAGFSERSELMDVGIHLIRENPFLGKGLGTFMDYAGQRIEHGDYAHDCYLQIWAESGVFSLFFFLLFLGTVLGKALKAVRRSGDPLLLGLLCGLTAFLTHSLFDNQFYSVAQAFLFWSMFGLLAVASQKPPALSKTGPSGSSLS